MYLLLDYSHHAMGTDAIFKNLFSLQLNTAVEMKFFSRWKNTGGYVTAKHRGVRSFNIITFQLCSVGEFVSVYVIQLCYV